MKSLSLDGTWSLRYCEAGEGERAGWPSRSAWPERARSRPPSPATSTSTWRAPASSPSRSSAPTPTSAAGWKTKTGGTPTEFTVPDGLRARRGGAGRDALTFEGLDTLADVWLNGTYVGSTRNAFISHAFDVAGASCRPGTNLLVVRVDTGLRWACTQDCDRYRWPGDATMAERIWLRRAQFTGGWDWGPRLLTVGIWRPVDSARLRAPGLARRSRHHRAGRRGLGRHQGAVRDRATSPRRDVDAEIDLQLRGQGRRPQAADGHPGARLQPRRRLLPPRLAPSVVAQRHR